MLIDKTKTFEDLTKEIIFEQEKLLHVPYEEQLEILKKIIQLNKERMALNG